MSFIKLDNGMVIKSTEAVKPDEFNIIRFTQATIELNGRTYICNNVEISLNDREMSYQGDPHNSHRTTWKTDLQP